MRWIAIILPVLAVGAAGSGCCSCCCGYGYPACAPMECRPQYCGTCAPCCASQFSGVPLAYNYGAQQFYGGQPYQPAPQVIVVQQPAPQPYAAQPMAQAPCADCCCKEGEWHEYKLVPLDNRGVALNVSLQQARTIRLKENPQGTCAVNEGGKEFCPPSSGGGTVTAFSATGFDDRISRVEKDLKTLSTKVDGIDKTNDALKAGIDGLKTSIATVKEMIQNMKASK